MLVVDADEDNCYAMDEKSVSSFSSDDIENPFLTHLKTKTKILNPEKVSKRQAIRTWRCYKSALIKLMPIINSQFETKGANTRLLLKEGVRYIMSLATKTKSFDPYANLREVLREIASVSDFIALFMEQFYPFTALRMMNIEYIHILRFLSSEMLLKQIAVVNHIRELLRVLSYHLTQEISTKDDFLLDMKIQSLEKLKPTDTHKTDFNLKKSENKIKKGTLLLRRTREELPTQAQPPNQPARRLSLRNPRLEKGLLGHRRCHS